MAVSWRGGLWRGGWALDVMTRWFGGSVALCCGSCVAAVVAADGPGTVAVGELSCGACGAEAAFAREQVVLCLALC